MALVFGVISPKIRTNSVRIPVPTPTYMSPKARVTRIVARDEAEIFTILLPIRIALNIFGWLSSTFIKVWALLKPASARFLTRILLTAIIAVSDDEKNADNANSPITMSICRACPESKKINSYFYMFLVWPAKKLRLVFMYTAPILLYSSIGVNGIHRHFVHLSVDISTVLDYN